MDVGDDLECERRRKDEEVDFWKRKFLELQNRFVIQKEIEFKITELEEKLEDGRVKYGALYVELQEKNAEFVVVEGKLKESTVARVSTENKLNNNKILCGKMNEECMRRFKDLEIQADLRLKYELDLENKLEAYKTKYEELSVRFREKKARGISLENELSEYKKMCVHLKEKIESLEEDIKALSEREKKEHKRITFLEEENKKRMKCDEGGKILQLNKDFEHGKRRAGDDNEVLMSKIRELETRADFWKKNGIELGKEVEVYRIKCNDLSLEIKDKDMECVGFEDKLRNLMSIKVAFENEIEGYKTAFIGLKEHIMGLAEDWKLSWEREKSQERITYLEEVVKNIGTGRESETQVLRLEEDNSAMRLLNSHGNREGESGPRVSQNEGKNNINERLCNEMDGATDDANVLRSTIEEKSNTEKILTSACTPSCNPTSLHGNRNEHVSGSCYMVKDDNMNTALASRVESVTIVEKQLGHELKGGSGEKLLMPEQGSVGTLLRGNIEIDDSDHGKEIFPNHTCNIRDIEMDQFSTDATPQRFLLNEHNLTPKNCLKRPLSDQRCEEYESISEEDETLIPLLATAKKSRITKVIISRTKSEDYVAIPVSRTMNLCARGQKMETSISPSRRRSVSPRQYPGKSYCANSTIKHLHKENSVDEVGSDDSEDKCLGGICVKLNSSDSSSSRDSLVTQKIRNALIGRINRF